MFATNGYYPHLRENQITNLPESIAKLSNLTWLDLSKNQITNLPESMAKLSNLTGLDLRGNQITNLPESMAKLSNLTQLYLSENKITNLPESMAKLSNLTLLDLSKNQITNLPESMAKLSNLTLLNLRGNQITNLPESMAKLSNLTQLYLSENKITNLPESMAKLSNLTGLDLRGNQITNLPESMAKLSNLTQLNLSKNQITNLPESIANLSNLKNLYLRGNPLVTPPLEIAEKGIEAIREYFEQLKPDSDYLYEAKLLIVGEGGAGKTTLAEVIEYYGKREIKIRVVGKHKRDLLIAVTHELDKTDDTMDLRRFDKSHRKQLIEDEREATERENEFLREIVKLQASKGINVRTETLMYDQRGAKFGGGFAGRDYKGDITYNYAQQGNLAEAAAEIQQLLEQLSQTNPTTTSKEKMIVVAEAVDTIESNPTLKGRVINALKAEGTEAFKEAIDHPLVNILMATIEGWQEV